MCFDLFAPYVGDILHGSERIRRLVAAMYPVIILDEFQDTNAAQWRVVQALGSVCRLIALADPEQRIYDWIGADPARLDHFREAFSSDGSGSQHGQSPKRRNGNRLFGNDCSRANSARTHTRASTVDILDPFPDPAMTKLVTTAYAARKRVSEHGVRDWSLAILVPTKKMTRLVSDALRRPPAGMTEVSHSAAHRDGGGHSWGGDHRSSHAACRDDRQFEPVHRTDVRLLSGQGRRRADTELRSRKLQTSAKPTKSGLPVRRRARPSAGTASLSRCWPYMSRPVRSCSRAIPTKTGGPCGASWRAGTAPDSRRLH